MNNSVDPKPTEENVKIDSRVVLITGGSSGLGVELARLYSKRGCSVAITARRSELLLKVAESISSVGGIAVAIPGDVSNPADCQRIVAESIQAFGTIDVLINNAGRGNLASVEDTTDEELANIFGVNVYSQFYMCREVLPIMRAKNSGSIVNISSVAGKWAYPFNSAYTSAKHAVVGFTAGLRAELAGTEINAFVVCPAGISTDWANSTEGGSIGELFSRSIRLSRSISQEEGLPLAPLQKMMSAIDVAKVVVCAEVSRNKNDLFTHDGTMELAQIVAENRREFENRNMSLYLAMLKTYPQLKQK